MYVCYVEYLPTIVLLFTRAFWAQYYFQFAILDRLTYDVIFDGLFDQQAKVKLEKAIYLD